MCSKLGSAAFVLNLANQFLSRFEVRYCKAVTSCSFMTFLATSRMIEVDIFALILNGRARERFSNQPGAVRL